jgi:hypothetical protein
VEKCFRAFSFHPIPLCLLYYSDAEIAGDFCGGFPGQNCTSSACRKNKGIHAAVNRLQQFMLKASCNRKKAAYFLQLDIRSFFMSIDKQILFTIFKNTNLSEELIDLLHEIIFHDCTENYYFKGDKAMLESIPSHKSLFKVEKGGNGFGIEANACLLFGPFQACPNRGIDSVVICEA